MTCGAVFFRCKTDRLAALLCLSLVLLLLCVKGGHASCETTACFTAAQQNNIRAFLLLLKGSIGSASTADWSGDDFCSWTGIACLPSGLMVSLERFDMTGQLPELSDDIQPEEVIINIFVVYGNSRMRGTLPASWGRLTSLKEFTAHHSTISGTLPAAWATLEKLRSFDILNTAVGGTLPVEWKKLSNLEYFRIRSSFVSGTLPSEWMSMTHMGTFDVSQSLITGTLPPEYAAWTNLVHLDLSSTQLSGTFPKEWMRFLSLESLSLFNTQLSGTLPAEFDNFSSLRFLYLLCTIVVLRRLPRLLESF